MLAFFYSIFLAIMTGQWQLYTLPEVNNVLRYTTNKISGLIVNTFGGDFQTIQTYELVDTVLATQMLSAILAIVAMVMVCIAVFKLTKMVFSIFFGGR